MRNCLDQRLTLLRYLCVLSTLVLTQSAAHPQDSNILAAAEYCAKRPPDDRRRHLSEDAMILCFDGAIPSYFDLAPVVRLKNGGLFVVRSVGGATGMSLAIADILWEKKATVIVRDYCLSSCANVFFVASQKTYVLANAIVAWHGGPTDCRNRNLAAAADKLYQKCFDGAFLKPFYEKRGIGLGHMIVPQTSHTRDLFYSTLDRAPNKGMVFWMWNPDNHRSYFKDRIAYESYPKSQDAVNAILLTSLPGIRVVYDEVRD